MERDAGDGQATTRPQLLLRHEPPLLPCLHPQPVARQEARHDARWHRPLLPARPDVVPRGQGVRRLHHALPDVAATGTARDRHCRLYRRGDAFARPHPRPPCAHAPRPVRSGARGIRTEATGQRGLSDGRVARRRAPLGRHSRPKGLDQRAPRLPLRLDEQGRPAPQALPLQGPRHTHRHASVD